jgi:hypothetical protein
LIDTGAQFDLFRQSLLGAKDLIEMEVSSKEFHIKHIQGTICRSYYRKANLSTLQEMHNMAYQFKCKAALFSQLLKH